MSERGARMSERSVNAILVDENTLDVHGVLFARGRHGKPVIVADESTDCATGYCKCSECGQPIDFWDRCCRWCGCDLERDAT